MDQRFPGKLVPRYTGRQDRGSQFLSAPVLTPCTRGPVYLISIMQERGQLIISPEGKNWPGWSSLPYYSVFTPATIIIWMGRDDWGSSLPVLARMMINKVSFLQEGGDCDGYGHFQLGFIHRLAGSANPVNIFVIAPQGEMASFPRCRNNAAISPRDWQRAGSSLHEIPRTSNDAAHQTAGWYLPIRLIRGFISLPPPQTRSHSN
jgi:hypothetical protein